MKIFECFYALAIGSGILGMAAPAGAFPRPTPGQLAWEHAELGTFFHYDLQVAHPHYSLTGSKTRRGDPFLSPKPPDTNQWLGVAKAMGARYAVYVCKHNSGYMFFQSTAYPFGLRQSIWGNGKVDMVRRFVDSCRKYGIKPGLYCSLATNYFLHVVGNLVNNGKGNDPVLQTAYSRTCEKMETELWRHYGPLFYCWFDGGELSVKRGGPNLVPILKKFQPDMVCFQGPRGSPGGLTRWIGNEAGQAPYPCWETVTRANESGAGDPNGKLWQPAEVDISVLASDHWFWRPVGANPLLTLGQLVGVYYHSIGRGCNLIINAPIDQFGSVPATVKQRLAEFGAEIQRRFGHSVAQTKGRGYTTELRLKKAHIINNVIIMERISEGQRIRRYEVRGLENHRWVAICAGESIGQERIQRFAPVRVQAVKLVILKAVATPLIRKLAVFDIAPLKR